MIIREWQASDGQRSDRSAGDRARHRQKIREVIRSNIADIIAEEAIIGQNRDRIIKVPIRGIKEYRFVFGENLPAVGQGDGDTQPGDVVGRDSEGRAAGQAGGGDAPGIDYYETEITLDELIEILFEQLELPEQEKKNLRQIEVESSRRYLGYKRKGIPARLSLRKSARERVRRLQKTRRSTRELQGELEREADRLRQAAGSEENPEVARSFLEQAAQQEQRREEMKRRLAGPSRSPVQDDSGARFPFQEDDLRYFRRRDKPRRESNAVVICIMDTSGSMDTMKKYLARSFFFLMHRFVVTRYAQVEVVFVAHHTEAREVTEEEFFHKGESGGTFISSGYLKALEIVQERYHPSLWNIYVFHCSDGDNFDSDNPSALKAARELCEVSQLFGYGEIKPFASSAFSGSSLREFFSRNIEAENYGSILIEKTEDVWPAFRSLLARERAAG